MSNRTFWYSRDLGIKDEPFVKSLIQYRQFENRVPVAPGAPFANLVSSITDDGKQMPILDLDFDHSIVKSTTDGHRHLYLNVAIPKWRWILLMWGLYMGRQIELGYFVWSLRRGGNFVRIEGVKKNLPAERTKPTYGWFRKLRSARE